MDRLKYTTPSDQQVPIERDEAKVGQMLEQALEEFGRSLRLQRQSVVILERLNHAVRESPAASERIEVAVDQLIVERLLTPGESKQADEIGEKERK